MIRLALLTLTSLLFLQAGSGNVPFMRIGDERGLSHLSVLAIAQDRQGFMWFGTQDGLNRYDGYRFRVFRHEAKDPRSLAENYVLALHVDSEGVLWVGTTGGLSRYDASLESFTNYYHDSKLSDSLGANWVNTLLESQGQLWVGTRNGGLNRLNRKDGRFQRFLHDPDKADSISSNQVLSLLEARDGSLWVGTWEGGLNRFDPTTEKFQVFRHREQEPNSLGDDRVCTLREDPDGSIWIGTWGGGLYRLDRVSNRFQAYRHRADDPQSLVNDEVRALLFDRSNRLWVGTFGGGIDRLDPQRTQFQTFSHRPEDRFSLVNNTVRCLFEDRTGLIWVGTDGGIGKSDLNTEVFQILQNDPNQSQSISQSAVRAIAEDESGRIWVGNDLGLDLLDREGKRLRTYRADDGFGLNADNVSVVHIDQLGRVWLGTFGDGLHRLDDESGKFQSWHHTPDREDGLSDNRVVALARSKQDLWIGTYGGGLNLMTAEGRFRHFKADPKNPLSLPDNIVRCLYFDREFRLWVGTYGGLSRMRASRGNFETISRDPHQANGLSNSKITAIFQDSTGQYWVGTRGGGLSRMHLEGENLDAARFEIFDSQEGLGSDNISAISEDRSGKIWVSTPNGLARIDPTTDTVHRFGVAEGTQSGGYFNGSSAELRDGRLAFGGINGMTLFDPSEIAHNPYPPEVALTGLFFLNQRVPMARMDPHSPLVKAIEETEKLVLDYKTYAFTLEFAALHFADPEQNRYKYMLEGLDSDWVHTDSTRRFASYTKLPAGSYRFLLKASNKDGIWCEQPRVLEIRIKPAPWRTVWAYLLYAACLIAAIAAWMRAQKRKLQRERELNERLIQADHLKDEFLANTSHELRTPLNGIIGIAESLIDGAAGSPSEAMSRNLGLIVASGRRLAGLVNDILDFSKMRNAELRLVVEPLNLYQIAEGVLQLSRHLIDEKPLTLTNAVSERLQPVSADRARLEQILLNLVGNAIKFSDEGEIRIEADRRGNRIQVRVRDQGPGIATDQQERIFESFQQLDGSATRHQGGTGLGLAISRQLARLHGSDLRLDSTLGKGSCFHFTLEPAPEGAKVEAHGRDHRISGLLVEALAQEAIPSVSSSEGSDFDILIVDDEPVNRQVLVNFLRPLGYQLRLAPSGSEALALVEAKVPDLILLDIMMPGLSGFDVCRKIRERHPSKSLPILFLTAKNQLSDLVTAFNVGGNDYLTKPFNRQELISRLSTHLELMRSTRSLIEYSNNLEGLVRDRTLELENRNLELARKNEEILRRQSQLIAQEKLASLGGLTAGIAHELSNPMNFVNNFAELIQELTKDLESELEQMLADSQAGGDKCERLEELRDYVVDLDTNAAAIRKHGKRAKNIIQRMMAFAMTDQDKPEDFDFNDMVSEYALLTVQAAVSKGELPHDALVLRLDPAIGRVHMLGQAFGKICMNLVSNAVLSLLEKRGKEPNFSPRLEVETRLLGEQIQLRVLDNGVGISESTQKRIFEPFFTTRPTGEGNVGLGLAITHDLVCQTLNGKIDLDTKLGDYAEFRVTIPFLRAQITATS